MTSGREALRIFHDEQKRLFNISYGLEEMIAEIGPKWFPDSLSTAFELDDNLTTTKIKNSMEKLAKQSNGKIPKNYQVFLKSLSEEVQDLDFKDYLVIAKETAVDAYQVGMKGLTIYTALQYVAILAPIAMLFFKNRKK